MLILIQIGLCESKYVITYSRTTNSIVAYDDDVTNTKMSFSATVDTTIVGVEEDEYYLYHNSNDMIDSTSGCIYISHVENDYDVIPPYQYNEHCHLALRNVPPYNSIKDTAAAAAAAQFPCGLFTAAYGGHGREIVHVGLFSYDDSLHIHGLKVTGDR